MPDAAITWIENLVGYPWPADVQADVNELVTGEAQAAEMWGAAAQATTFDEFVHASTIEVADTFAIAAVVRARLGLPTNISDTQDWCAGLT